VPSEFEKFRRLRKVYVFTVDDSSVVHFAPSSPKPREFFESLGALQVGHSSILCLALNKRATLNPAHGS
jgi:hypothetical protein